MTRFPGVVDLRISIFIFYPSPQFSLILQCKFAVQEINRPMYFAVYVPTTLSRTMHPLQGYSPLPNSMNMPNRVAACHTGSNSLFNFKY
jgi:hypothetical protein